MNSIGKVDGESFRSLSQSQGRRKHLANAFLEEALHSVENYPKVCCVRSCAFRNRRNGAVVSTSCCRSVEFFLFGLVVHVSIFFFFLQIDVNSSFVHSTKKITARYFFCVALNS